jgi:hypothetical protein
LTIVRGHTIIGEHANEEAGRNGQDIAKSLNARRIGAPLADRSARPEHNVMNGGGDDALDMSKLRVDLPVFRKKIA